MSEALTARPAFERHTEKTLRLSANAKAYLFATPAVLVFSCLVLYPIGHSFWISFFNLTGAELFSKSNEANWVGLANYLELLDDPRFWTSLQNTILWFLLFMLAIPGGLAIALLVNQNIRGIWFYRSLFFFPFVISQVVVGLIFTWFYDPHFGLIGKIWHLWDGEAPAILGDPNLVNFGLIAAGLWPQTAFCAVIYLTGLCNLSQDQIEAARLDNARGWRLLRYVILPQLRPATFIAFLVTAIGALRSYDLVVIMTDGGPYGSSRVLSYFMYEQALSEYGTRQGYGAAIAVVLFFLTMSVLAIFVWRTLRLEAES
ncbi:MULTISPECIES: sugar ABC transporter permease [Alphaproteobacteria]|uniref:carbohydrate ABC transporter permease n=1 Tax=Alphaproteobacteria TaxID=28211 RepID=UPI003264B23F